MSAELKPAVLKYSLDTLRTQLLQIEEYIYNYAESIKRYIWEDVLKGNAFDSQKRYMKRVHLRTVNQIYMDNYMNYKECKVSF